MARQNDLLMDISILYRSTQKYYDKKLANLSLTYAQLPILIAIYEEEGISMQKIALDGGYDKGTITKNVQKLVNLGYVIVQSSIKDKRAKELYTTDKTKEVMNQITAFEEIGGSTSFNRFLLKRLKSFLIYMKIWLKTQRSSRIKMMNRFSFSIIRKWI